MSKKAKQSRFAANEAQAMAKSIRVSPRKLGLVAGLIRGLNVKEALVQLTFMQKRIAKDVKMTLQSAIANAENNKNLDVDRLYVSEVTVGKSFVMKRFHARARGRAAGIEKPFAHLFITVRERKESEKPQAKAPKAKAEKKNKKGNE